MRARACQTGTNVSIWLENQVCSSIQAASVESNVPNVSRPLDVPVIVLFKFVKGSVFRIKLLKVQLLKVQYSEYFVCAKIHRII